MRLSKRALVTLYLSSLILITLAIPLGSLAIIYLFIIPLYIFILTSLLNLTKTKGALITIISFLLSLASIAATQIIWWNLCFPLTHLPGSEAGFGVFLYICALILLTILYSLGVGIYLNYNFDTDKGTPFIEKGGLTRKGKHILTFGLIGMFLYLVITGFLGGGFPEGVIATLYERNILTLAWFWVFEILFGFILGSLFGWLVYAIRVNLFQQDLETPSPGYPYAEEKEKVIPAEQTQAVEKQGALIHQRNICIKRGMLIGGILGVIPFLFNPIELILIAILSLFSFSYFLHPILYIIFSGILGAILGTFIGWLYWAVKTKKI